VKTETMDSKRPYLRLTCALFLLATALVWAVALGGCSKQLNTGQRGGSHPGAPESAPPPPLKVLVQPLVSTSAGPLGNRPVRQMILDEAVRALREAYRGEMVLLPPKPLPDAAYYPPRDRYRADKLLDWLHKVALQNGGRVVGITEVDISATKGEHPDWGLFGLGNMPGRECVVSTYRLRSRTGDRLLRQRVSKVVVHELAHTYGLDHCPTKGCLMEDAQARVSTVDAESGFCQGCQRKLQGVLR
jgi:archaemetzincin